MKTIHLICNAHIDPVYLWQWEEGAAEALSTFRTAAEFCENREAFVFNHNEAVLYQWIREYDPGLFERIRSLVRQGKWHIMGGWYLQPDCNMPSGESLVRQILAGRRFFKEHFGVVPRTAINFDPFGHSRGLVQILVKAGFDSYLFCRPEPAFLPLPSADFRWKGYDGSLIRCHRALDLYKSRRGDASARIDRYLDQETPAEKGLVLWGIGNHGGGPSREDLDAIDQAREGWDDGGYRVVHSTPEAYFCDPGDSGPEFAEDLNPWAVGCYTSQIRLKQKHRELENSYYLTEKMASHAALSAGLSYPGEELRSALEDLLLSEFHDILPGSSVKSAEESSLRLLDHGLEILSRVRARALFRLGQSQPPVPPGVYPLFLYNPHPWEVRSLFDCEFQLADQNLKDSFTDFILTDESGKEIPCQIEKEESNIPVDWRKKILFQAVLAPGQLNRFLCRPRMLPRKPAPEESQRFAVDGSSLMIFGDTAQWRLSTTKGTLEEMLSDGQRILGADSFLPIVMKDSFDPWGALVDRFDGREGSFRLMTPEEAARFCRTPSPLPPVRVIESGPVRTVAEALFRYDESVVLQRYAFHHESSSIDLSLRVFWREKDRMLKWQIHAAPEEPVFSGQTAYGRQEYPRDGRERISQKWTAILSKSPEQQGFLLIDTGIYGVSCRGNQLFPSLLRSSAYAAYPVEGKTVLRTDRYTDRMDQGERTYRFRLTAGPSGLLKETADRRALEFNEQPYALSFSPPGGGAPAPSILELSGSSVVMTAFKQEEQGENYILRLFEPTGTKATLRITSKLFGLHRDTEFAPYEIKTFRLEGKNKRLVETDLMEGLESL